MKLNNVKLLGRYKKKRTHQIYSIYQGTNRQRGVDLLFYLFHGARIYISDADFYSGNYEKLIPKLT